MERIWQRKPGNTTDLDAAHHAYFAEDDTLDAPMTVDWSINPEDPAFTGAIPAWRYNQKTGGSQRFRLTVFSLSEEQAQSIDGLHAEDLKAE
ncbi:MAG: hypothetical protein U1E05_12290 [Patescibacteria group bacterium]|nr:hypothetical protein [Patescibacteria group bacterium]